MLNQLNKVLNYEKKKLNNGEQHLKVKRKQSKAFSNNFHVHFLKRH